MLIRKTTGDLTLECIEERQPGEEAATGSNRIS